MKTDDGKFSQNMNIEKEKNLKTGQKKPFRLIFVNYTSFLKKKSSKTLMAQK